MVCGKLTFISGGVRSGKSAYAERLLVNQWKEMGGRLVYIASGSATDGEMIERIRRHQRDRAAFHWVTLEQPTQLAAVLPSLKRGDLVLWDCVTTWLANELYSGWETGNPCIAQPNCMPNKIQQMEKTVGAILDIASALVIVSNEVLEELPAKDAETEVYRKFLGDIHQTLVSKANGAIEMDSGLPIYWKKEMCE